MKNFRINSQKGYSVLAVLLMTAVLITAVSFVAFGRADPTNVISNSAVTQTVTAQAGIIRSRILACGIEYPTGNNGTIYRTQYPSGITATNVATLTCPGAANSNIWTLLDGVTPPNRVNGFGIWQYTNDATNMRLTLVANNPDRIALLPTLVTLLGSAQTTIVGGNTLSWVLVQ